MCVAQAHRLEQQAIRMSCCRNPPACKRHVHVQAGDLLSAPFPHTHACTNAPLSIDTHRTPHPTRDPLPFRRTSPWEPVWAHDLHVTRPSPTLNTQTERNMMHLISYSASEQAQLCTQGNRTVCLRPITTLSRLLIMPRLTHQAQQPKASCPLPAALPTSFEPAGLAYGTQGTFGRSTNHTVVPPLSEHACTMLIRPKSPMKQMQQHAARLSGTVSQPTMSTQLGSWLHAVTAQSQQRDEAFTKFTRLLALCDQQASGDAAARCCRCP
jgi:hypothetical protein